MKSKIAIGCDLLCFRFRKEFVIGKFQIRPICSSYLRSFGVGPRRVSSFPTYALGVSCFYHMIECISDAVDIHITLPALVQLYAHNMLVFSSSCVSLFNVI